MDRVTLTNGKLYAHYTVQAEVICLGERIRGGILRPCIDVFTYTGLVGALKARFPHPYRSIHAIGRFRNFRREILIFSPRDRGREASVVPLEIECLTNVQADLYVQLNDFTITWPSSFTFRLGAMKSKGFGQCKAAKVGEVRASEPRLGKLIMRVPDNRDILDALGIEEVAVPVFGYLFQPDRGGTGHYVRALFEGSTVKADPILLAERVRKVSMNDPVADLIKNIKSDGKIGPVARKLTANFLNNVAEVFETYGFATTRQYLKEQQSRGGKLQVQATAVLAALDHMEKSELVHRNRSVGRLVIKTLRQVYSQ